MAFGSTPTTTSKPSLMSRLRHRQPQQTITTTTTISPSGAAHSHSTVANNTTGANTTTTGHGHGHHNTRAHKKHHLGRDAAIGVGGYEAEKHHHRVKKNRRAAGASGGVGVGGAQRRKVGLGDKISGALLKVKGSLTGRPGVKAAGTRRMHGTDGRGSVRAY